MKKLALITLVLISFTGKAQNEMTYQSEVWDNGLTYIDKKIDITYFKDNSLVSARLADSIVSHIDHFMIRNTATDYRMLQREFSINANWGVTMITALALGDYSGYYSSYQDTIMTNFFDLIFSNNKEGQMELSTRLRNELTTNKSTLLNEICVGYTIENNKKVVGVLLGFSLADGYAVLLEKRGVFCWYVDYYTFCLATELEIEAYNEGISYLNF